MQLFPYKKGISGAFIENHRFKNELLTVRLLLPLKKDTVTENGMVAELLTECSDEYPTLRLLHRRLSELYGASVSASVEKLSDSLLITFEVYCLSDKYSIDKTPCFTAACDILYGMLTSPHMTDGKFCEEDINRVRRVWCERIESEINRKRSYARNRCVEIMCEDEPFGIPSVGYLENARNITGEKLLAAYRRILSEASVRITFVGESFHNDIFLKLASVFDGGEKYIPNQAQAVAPPEKVNRITEKMNITQGKLVMGFRMGIAGDDRKTYPYVVAADVFGGGPYSKLFTVVREKMSLCYYCAAQPIRNKGIVLVDCGVDDVNAEKTCEAILEQLKEIAVGNISEEVVENSKRSICDSLRGIEDSSTSIEGWYGKRMNCDDPASPNEVMKLLESVTLDDVVKCCADIKPDTFYFLLSDGTQKEGADE